VAAGRRPIAPTRTSSIVRAGETGETGPLRGTATAGTPAGDTDAVTLADDPDHSSAFAATPPGRAGSFANRAFFAWRSATRSILGARPGRAVQASLVHRAGGAPGVPIPSQVSSRNRVDAPRANEAASVKFPRRRFTAASEASRCSAFLPVRAHVPFVPLGPPRLIFVGVADRLLEKRDICKSDRPGMEMASTSGLQLPSAVRSPAPVRPVERSCLGLRLLQGWRALLPCIGRARPRIRSPASGTPACTVSPAAFLSARGFTDARSHHPSTFARGPLPATGGVVIAKY
jgi:hypothetical protein